MTIPDYSERPPDARRPMFNLRSTDTRIPHHPLDGYDIYYALDFLAARAGTPPDEDRKVLVNALTVTVAYALGIRP